MPGSNCSPHSGHRHRDSEFAGRRGGRDDSRGRRGPAQRAPPLTHGNCTAAGEASRYSDSACPAGSLRVTCCCWTCGRRQPRAEFARRPGEGIASRTRFRPPRGSLLGGGAHWHGGCRQLRAAVTRWCEDHGDPRTRRRALGGSLRCGGGHRHGARRQGRAEFAQLRAEQGDAPARRRPTGRS